MLSWTFARVDNSPIHRFEGVRDIESLPVRRLYKGSDQRNELGHRGQRFASLQGQHYLEYLGPMLVTELKEPCSMGAGQVPNTSCRALKVSCPGLEPIQVQIRITEPAAGVPFRGTVVVGSGRGGHGFYAGTGKMGWVAHQPRTLGLRAHSPQTRNREQ